MRSSLEIPLHLVKQATLYAPSRDPLDAVCYILDNYPKLVAELRQARARLHQLDTEASDLDARLSALQDACRAILDL
jgi:uncharacterized protein YlxW (UPF0749 family)